MPILVPRSDVQAQMRYDSTTQYTQKEQETYNRRRNRILVVDDESDSCLAVYSYTEFSYLGCQDAKIRWFCTLWEDKRTW